ncbi:hypothetical protein CONLIGDRAFT_7691 [Coniochaeta ligniaria NRRL 30616]|uniref:Uncharacterized protein n=1 Tax=Coniochaeta ligniaria NRRL 30616 TaxID=1408157 RepID=A0A1J7J333_9PEZI|nr:hypothetical protein CONLIGDRAFT_7691 [Coniochaeta ligniaria NRRL 30616]
MVAARHIRPALFAVAATLSFFAQVEARTSTTLNLSSCVTSCIKKKGGCETSDVKCVCQGAKSSYLLDHVAICMYNDCPDQIRTFDASFITPLVSACNIIGKSVPQSLIDEADQTAQTFADKLPPLSTSKTLTTSTTSAKATPKTTVTSTSESEQSTSSTTSKAQPTETETSTTSSVDDETTTAAASSTTTESKPTTTLAIATSSPSRAATQSSTSTQGASRSDPTDSSPFATPPNAAGRSVTSWALASLPLALAVLMR